MRAELQGWREFVTRLEAAGEVALVEADKQLDTAAPELREAVKSRTHDRTGELDRGMVVLNPGIGVREVESRAPHTIYVEYGTKDVKAQRMMRRAARKEGKQIMNRARVRLQSSMEKVLRG